MLLPGLNPVRVRREKQGDKGSSEMLPSLYLSHLTPSTSASASALFLQTLPFRRVTWAPLTHADFSTQPHFRIWHPPYNNKVSTSASTVRNHKKHTKLGRPLVDCHGVREGARGTSTEDASMIATSVGQGNLPWRGQYDCDSEFTERDHELHTS